MNATGSTDAPGPNPALMSALTTEHYTLQSSQTSTIVEANGRSMLLLSSVSGATVSLELNGDRGRRQAVEGWRIRIRTPSR